MYKRQGIHPPVGFQLILLLLAHRAQRRLTHIGLQRVNRRKTCLLYTSPFNACEFQSKGDAIADLVEDMAAAQKARVTYDNILRTISDPEICDPIRFLREREIVHFQRFGETLRNAVDNIETKNFYAYNPDFDTPPKEDCK